MKTKLILAAAALTLSGAAFASSHREAPAIANDPAADNTDVYAFVSTTTTANDTLNIVANWIPFEEPSGGPNFFKWSDDVQYKIHIHKGNGPITDSVVYTFRFTTQTIPTTDPAATCTTGAASLYCIGGGKEFFAQLTGDTQTTGGAIIQTYTVTKSVAGQADVVISTNTLSKPLISAPENIGPRTQAVLAMYAPNLVTSATYDDNYATSFISTLTDGTKLFAGPRDDGFYVDLGGIFDLANLRPKAGAGDCTTRGGSCTKAQDGLAGFNVHSIAIAIPTTQLTGNGAAPTVGAPSDANTVGIWATSSRQKVSIQRANGSTSAYGPWVQVSRLGLPLINEAVIGYQDKDKYNRTTPSGDVTNFGAYFLNPVIVPDAEAVGILTATTAAPVLHNRTDIIDIISLAATGCTTYPTTPCHTVALSDGSTGDVLRVDLGLDPVMFGFPNGRSLTNAAAPNMEQADVTDVELSLLLGGIPALSANGDSGHPPAIQDHVDYNDKPFLQVFPWLAAPWEGFSQGHGKTTP